METPEKKIRITDPKVGLLKAQSWCAYQERCQQEVRDKLYEWGLYPDAVENIIVALISDNFLNEERFAVAYAGGKFRIKKWGRVKIRQELKKRRISDYCIRKAMAEIDSRDYLKTLRKLAADKIKATPEKHYLKKKYKVMRYLLSKGYEQDLIQDVMANTEA